MNLLLIWSTESIIGLLVVLFVCVLLSYFAFFRVNGENILQIFIDMNEEEPFPFAAKLLSLFLD